MNQTTIAGNLGADPEVRFTSSGQKVTSLRVAARARRSGKDETIWWKVTIWGEQFDKMIVHLKKGSSVVVVGEMSKPEIYTDREGKPQVSLGLTAYNVSFSPFGRPDAGPKENNQAQEPAFAHADSVHGQNNMGSSFSEDDIPF